MGIIPRKIQKPIENSLFKRKIIIIYGARQVGKTTLVKEILKKYAKNSAYYDCDEPDIRQALVDKTSTELKAFFGKNKLIVLDEAQRIKNIGLILKLIADNFPDIQVIATGSSSFDLANNIIEPLTGRKYEFYLYPFSYEELKSVYSEIEFDRLLEQRIIFGMYPGVIFGGSDSGKYLKELAQSYLYKDILQYGGIKHSEVIEKLIQALALQISNEVSYNELALTVGIDKNTVASYIEILEKAFIVFRLKPFSRNLRNELKKLRKIYFYDTGIRNAVINNLNPMNLRNDVGSLWENFMVSERLKYNQNNQRDKNIYFWRTRAGQEIDYLEEAGGQIKGYEFKWLKQKFRPNKIFLSAYPESKIQLINRSNYSELFKD